MITKQTSRERFAEAAIDHGWTIEHGDDWLVTYRKGKSRRRYLKVQFAVGGPGDRPVGANTYRTQWPGRRHGGPLVDWILKELAREATPSVK